MKTSRTSKQGLILAALLALHTAPHAGPVDLSDTPLPVQSSVAPNIMFMFDTSGSMGYIIPDAPYDPSVTYLSSCPAANTVPGGVAAPAIPTNQYVITYIVAGVPRLYVYDGSAYVYRTFGTDEGKYCFDPALRYDAALKQYPSSDHTAYDGNFLNWYFCTGAAPNCNSGASFGTGADRRPGAKTRLEVAKVAATAIVNSLDTVRTGLARYNSTGTGSHLATPGGELTVEMALNDASQKTKLTTAINSFTAAGGTPLSGTLSGIGAYFSMVPSGSTAGSLVLHKGQANQTSKTAAQVFSEDGAMLRNGVSGTPTIAAPVQYACQKSFAVLMTDGRPDGDRPLSNQLCDYLGIAGGCGEATTWGQKLGANASGNGTGADAGYHVNGTYKQKHLGDPHSYQNLGSDYLDDVAAALYEIDLRPDLAKTGTQKNNVSTYMIGFADQASMNDPLMKETAAAGGGLFSGAADSSALVAAFQAAADDIMAKDGSAAAVAVANAHVTNTDNASYATSYNSGTWTGDLIAYPINTNTGVPNINTPIWDTGCATPSAYVDPTDTTKGVLGCSAQVQLNLRTSEDRKIFTSNDTAACFVNCGIPFQPNSLPSGTAGVDKLSAAQQTLLNTPTLTDGAAVIDYLRGVRTGETAQIYRTRTHLLGDMVNAEPLVIREPDRNYVDLDYGTFKTAKANRARIVFQVSNDGMAHAFNALTGAELWAYVPNLLISNSKDPLNTSTSLLNTRSRKTGFNHYFLLDGTPISGDVDFANAGTTGVTTTDWRTIVVGGMGKGGRGYYALDVTSTTAADEAAAAAKALWEFPRSITNPAKRAEVMLDMGFSYGKPIIVKTEAKGWVVLIASGYNNGTGTGESGGDGLGHLYVVNAKTGDLIADLVTTGCHASPTANACGLAHFNTYIENKDKDNTAELAYGGDLHGNLWRFDLRGTTVAGWSVSKMAVLRSGAAGSTVQPITTVPELGKITVSGVDKYMVYIGTGLFLGRTDLPCPPSGSCAWTPNTQSTQTQTMYGLLDTRTTTTLPDPLRSTLVAQTYTTSGNNRTMTTNAVSLTTKNGWYVDFSGGERLVTDSAIASGTLVFTSAIPSTTPCIPGGSSWLYAIDYETGGRVSGSTYSGSFLGNALASRPVLIQLPDGKVMALTRLSDTTTVINEVPVPSPTAAQKRVSWRELFDN